MKYDLTRYAAGEAPPLEDNGHATQMTFPDLHGNALAALFRLEAHGILELTQKQRQRVAALYLESQNATAEVITEFERILDEVTIHANKFKCIRLIGDVLGDRGKNDFLTLLLLNKLKEAGVKTTILFSNHDLELIAWRLAKQTSDPQCQNVLIQPTVALHQRRSLDNLIKFIETNPEFCETLYGLIDNVYKPMVKLIDYTVNLTGETPVITLYTHVPVGLELLQTFAKRYAIPYDISTHKKLIKMIELINTQFSQELIAHPTELATKLAEELEFFRTTEEVLPSIDPFAYPFLYAAWNRSAEFLIGLSDQPYFIHFIHGHMGRLPSPWENKKNPKVTAMNIDYNNYFGYSDPNIDLTQYYGKAFDSLNSYFFI